MNGRIHWIDVLFGIAVAGCGFLRADALDRIAPVIRLAIPLAVGMAAMLVLGVSRACGLWVPHFRRLFSVLAYAALLVCASYLLSWGSGAIAVIITGDWNSWLDVVGMSEYAIEKSIPALVVGFPLAAVFARS